MLDLLHSQGNQAVRVLFPKSTSTLLFCTYRTTYQSLWMEIGMIHLALPGGSFVSYSLLQESL